MDSYHKIFKNKQVAMVVMAHPDDLDAYCGGTVARLVADGKKVIALKLTAGNRGSQGRDVSTEQLATIRLNEDAEAMKTLGVKSEHCFNLEIGDGEVENSLKIIEQISYYIRKF